VVAPLALELLLDAPLVAEPVALESDVDESSLLALGSAVASTWSAVRGILITV
jgi:hypothetical protein